MLLRGPRPAGTQARSRAGGVAGLGGEEGAEREQMRRMAKGPAHLRVAQPRAVQRVPDGRAGHGQRCGGWLPQRLQGKGGPGGRAWAAMRRRAGSKARHLRNEAVPQSGECRAGGPTGVKEE